MSAALDLIRLAQEAGVMLRPRLWAEGADRLDSATRAELRAHESEVIRLLLDQPDAASDAAFEATERAAIQAEGEHSNAKAPIPHSLPPSWSDPAIIPTAGATCSCCRTGRTWWTETGTPKGWRCRACHPPAHLRAGQFIEALT